MEQFTEEEKAILTPFCSNIDRDVFALLNLPEVVKGALFSRYSRSDKPLRRLLLDEFIKNEKTGFSEIVSYAKSAGMNQIVATQKAEEFYDRILLGFGDDSVAELGGAHVACENVSNIASKILEDSRLGISPLEKSTRYVYFDKKTGGKYLYLEEPKIMASRHAELYKETCDGLFESYAKWIEPLRKYLTEKFPRREESERAYNSSIKAKACDILRGYLPASTLTNLGLFGNGRAFEYLLIKMYSSPLAEINGTAETMHAELSKAIPSFVKRAKGEFGGPTIKYLKETRECMQALADKAFEDIEPEATIQNNRDAKEVTLTSYDSDAEEKVIAASLYPHTALPLQQVREKANAMDSGERAKIISQYLGNRLNRRHKPGRGFEHAYYEFDVLMNYASYRDLHRHRVLTQQRQRLTVKHGYDLPKELAEIGADREFRERMQEAEEAYWKISKDLKDEAQYVVPFAYKIRYACCMNLRELYHLVELRSTPHGHPDYRRVALKMLDEVKKVQPSLVAGMKFANYSDAGLERLESEKMIDKRIEETKRKYGG
ncbi:Thymidylate synthase ThyX [uncultured archaeon]|nr:Thymidylate synthase ThyX [uncultured archaeon]